MRPPVADCCDSPNQWTSAEGEVEVAAYYPSPVQWIAQVEGHPDFIGGIDNEALDFGQLDSFIHVSNHNHNDNNNPPPLPPSSVQPSQHNNNGNNTNAQNVVLSSHNGNHANANLHMQHAAHLALPCGTVSSVAKAPALDYLAEQPGQQSPCAHLLAGTGATHQNPGQLDFLDDTQRPRACAAIATLDIDQLSDRAPSHLPESPPDSSSEPPYSPSDIHAVLHGVAGHAGSDLATAMLLDGPQAILAAPGLPDDLSPSGVTVVELGVALNPHLQHQHHHQQQQQQPHQTHQHQHHLGILSTMGYSHPKPVDSAPGGAADVKPIKDCTVDQQLSRNTLMDLGTQQFHDEHNNNNQLPELYQPNRIQSISTSTSPTSTSGAVAPSRKRKISAGVQQQQHKKPTGGHTDQQHQPTASVKPEPALSPLSLSHVSSLLEPPTSPASSSSPTTSILSSTANASNSGACATPASTASSTIHADTTADASSTHNSDSGDTCPMQCIRFAPFQQQNWHSLCDQSLQDLPMPHYRVDADKGFNFSSSDEAFVCQKKNHFQITCHAQLQGTAIFVRTSGGLEKIKSFHLHFYGVKLETPTQTIRVEQSQSDRSKKPFHPVLIDLQNRQVSKVTVGRLHFSETTSNNMRKKGRPNPEQRYFQLVVGLHAHTHSGHFPVISHGSERIIVRASNPGQFESDVELCWQRGVTQDSIYHAGRVGINTDRPDESLVVHGNLKVSGHIVQPSDSRAKLEIGELDTAEQLRNVQRIRVVKYRYEPEFALQCGRDTEVVDTGVIAQEIRKVLPDAVKEAGSVRLPNGQVIEQFLFVNKDRIYMENIGAVKELCKVTGSLELRIEQLERINARLARIQKVSDCSPREVIGDLDSADEVKSAKKVYSDEDVPDGRYVEICSNKIIQIVIVVLVVIMATCLAAISTLYFVEHNYSGYAHRVIIQQQTPNSQYVLQGSGGHQHSLNLPPDTTNQLNHLGDRNNWSKASKISADYPFVPSGAPVPPPDPVQHTLATTTNTSPAPTKPIASHYDVKQPFAKRISPPGSTTSHQKTSASPTKSTTSDATALLRPVLVEDPAEHNGWLPDVDSNLIDTGQKHVAKPKNDSHLLVVVASTDRPVVAPPPGPAVIEPSGAVVAVSAPATDPKSEDNIDINLLHPGHPEVQPAGTGSAPPAQPNPLTVHHRERTVEIVGTPDHCALQAKQLVVYMPTCTSTCCAECGEVHDTPAKPISTATNELQPALEIPLIPNPMHSEPSPQSAGTTSLFAEPPPNQQLQPPVDIVYHELIEARPNQTESSFGNRPEKQPPSCQTVHVSVQGDAFNKSLGTETLCTKEAATQHNFTYNVPLSRYLVTDHVQLVFRSPIPLHWHMCSVQQRLDISEPSADTTSAHWMEMSVATPTNIRFPGLATAQFDVTIPTTGYFVTRLDFRSAPLDTVDENPCPFDADDSMEETGPSNSSDPGTGAASRGTVVDEQPGAMGSQSDEDDADDAPKAGNTRAAVVGMHARTPATAATFTIHLYRHCI